MPPQTTFSEQPADRPCRGRSAPRTLLALALALAPILVQAATGTAERVHVDAALLAAAPETLRVELAPGEPRTAYLTAFERAPDGGQVWRGRFAADDPGYASVTLSQRGGVVHGRFELPGGPTWLLRPHPGGGSRLYAEGSVSGGGPEGGPGGALCGVGSGTAATPLPAAPSLLAPNAAAATGAGRVVDVLILYTPRAAAQLGAEQIEQLAPHHVDVLNTTLANSRVDGRARFAGVAMADLGMPALADQQAVDYLFAHPVARALQDRYQADVVSVVADGFSEFVSSFCGWANLMFLHLRGPQMADQAYNVLSHRCYDLSWLFAHEVAHNFGAHHDPANAGPPEFNAYPFAFAHGVDGHFRTLMSYSTACDDCEFLEGLLSNPLIAVGGIPAGIEGERDNARTLDLTFPLVASFRTGRPPAAGPAAPDGLAASALSPSEVALTWNDNAGDETGFQVERLLAAVPEAGWQRVASPPADATAHTVGGMAADTAYRFRVRAMRGSAPSAFSAEAAVRTPPATPAAPAALSAAPLSAGEVRLSWEAAARATGYEVELRGPDPAADRTAALAVTATEGVAEGATGAALEAVVGGLAAGTPYTFRVRAVNAAGASPWSAAASAATDLAAPPAGCAADAATLCLLAGRFAVTAAWRNPRAPFNHGAAAARAAPGSERTGLFTFFNPANVELAVKMLDGRAVNGAFWHFFGALSDVEYWVTVRDLAAGTSRTYHNPPFALCGRGDTAAFPGAPEAPAAHRAALGAALPAPPRAPLLARPAAAEAGGCVPGEETLCLAAGRFAVAVDWVNPRLAGDAGVGRVYAGLASDLTGHFWFFRPDNLELSVKVLDGRAINGHFWIFWGGLSDVGYTLRVTDTESGVVHEFENPPLTLCGGAVTDVL